MEAAAQQDAAPVSSAESTSCLSEFFDLTLTPCECIPTSVGLAALQIPVTCHWQKPEELQLWSRLYCLCSVGAVPHLWNPMKLDSKSTHWSHLFSSCCLWLTMEMIPCPEVKEKDTNREGTEGAKNLNIKPWRGGLKLWSWTYKGPGGGGVGAAGSRGWAAFCSPATGAWNWICQWITAAT